MPLPGRVPVRRELFHHHMCHSNTPNTVPPRAFTRMPLKMRSFLLRGVCLSYIRLECRRMKKDGRCGAYTSRSSWPLAETSHCAMPLCRRCLRRSAADLAARCLRRAFSPPSSRAPGPGPFERRALRSSLHATSIQCLSNSSGAPFERPRPGTEVCVRVAHAAATTPFRRCVRWRVRR